MFLQINHYKYFYWLKISIIWMYIFIYIWFIKEINLFVHSKVRWLIFFYHKQTTSKVCEHKMNPKFPPYPNQYLKLHIRFLSILNYVDICMCYSSVGCFRYGYERILWWKIYILHRYAIFVELWCITTPKSTSLGKFTSWYSWVGVFILCHF